MSQTSSSHPDLQAVDHIGIVVRDFEQGLALYRDVLGLRLHRTEDLPSGLRIAMFETEGAHVEILAPYRAGTAIDRFLEKRGEGIHHIAYRVDDIEQVRDRLVQSGLAPLTDRPGIGFGGTLTLFFHPKSTLGTLVELVQHPRA